MPPVFSVRFQHVGQRLLVHQSTVAPPKTLSAARSITWMVPELFATDHAGGGQVNRVVRKRYNEGVGSVRTGAPDGAGVVPRGTLSRPSGGAVRVSTRQFLMC